MKKTITTMMAIFAIALLFGACKSDRASQEVNVQFMGKMANSSAVPTDAVITLSVGGEVTNNDGTPISISNDVTLNGDNNFAADWGSAGTENVVPGTYNVVASLSGNSNVSLQQTNFSFTVEGGVELLQPIVLKSNVIETEEKIDVAGTTASLVQATTALDGAETTLETTWAAHQADPVTTTSQAVLDAFSPAASETGSTTSAILVAKDHRDRAVANGADPLSDEIAAADLALSNAETEKLEAMTTMNNVLMGLYGEAATSGDQATLDAIAALSAQITALGDVATQGDLDALLAAIQAAIDAIPGANPEDMWCVARVEITVLSGVDGSLQTVDIHRFHADGSTALEILGCASPCMVEGLPVNQSNTLRIEATGLQTVDYVEPPHANAEPTYANVTMWPPAQLGWCGALKVEVGKYLNLTAFGYEVCDYDADNVCLAIDQTLVTFMGVSGDVGATSVFVLDQAFIDSEGLTDADFMFGSGFAVGDLVLRGVSPGCTQWNASYNSENTDPDPWFRAYEMVGGNESPTTCQ